MQDPSEASLMGLTATSFAVCYNGTVILTIKFYFLDLVIICTFPSVKISYTLHVPLVIRQFSTMKQFTGQGVEKNNDDVKRILFA